jgi:CBS domain-containing protein
MRVQDVMTVEVVTARRETSLKDAARELAERGISGMPVVDEAQAVLGVLSEGDVLGKERPAAPDDGGAAARFFRHEDPEARRALDARTVGDAMSSPAITIEPHWPLATAAEQMVEQGVNRLPVVQQGRLVGIVTRADLVRAFARSDDQIAGEIRELVALQQELHRDENPIEVSVAGGEVSLGGEVRRQDEVEILPRMVRTVPGVVSVRSELNWAEPDR